MKIFIIIPFLLIGIFYDSYAVVTDLEGKVKKITEKHIYVDVYEEGCQGLRKFKASRFIKTKLKEGNDIKFKAKIDRTCNGEIVELEEQK